MFTTDKMSVSKWEVDSIHHRLNMKLMEVNQWKILMKYFKGNTGNNIIVFLEIEKYL